jgi:hypothetical protein
MQQAPMPNAPIDRRRHLALLAAPGLLLATTYLVFSLAPGWFGLKLGYFTGFLFYWLVW